MLPQRLKKAIPDNPKKVADLIDLHNVPATLREFLGQSQSSALSCFIRVWSYIKTNKLQGLHQRKNLEPYLHRMCNDPLVIQDQNDKNKVNCDDKLKSILLGKSKVELAELPHLVKLLFPKQSK